MFDEMQEDGGGVRAAYRSVSAWLEATPTEVLAQKRAEAEHLFRRIGVTFAVYSEGGDPERLIPFDIIPRVIGADEWATLERGLVQRVNALNAFLRDIYSKREIVAAGVF